MRLGMEEVIVLQFLIVNRVVFEIGFRSHGWCGGEPPPPQAGRMPALPPPALRHARSLRNFVGWLS